MRFARRRGAIAAAAATALLAPAVAVIGVSEASTASTASSARSASQRLQEAVTLDATLDHLRNLQKIADANDGNRAAGTSGYAASAGYIAGQLASAGYDVQYDVFEFPFFIENSPSVLERVAPDAQAYTLGEDFIAMTYSGSGDVTAPVEAVDVTLPPPAEPGSTSGCEPEDFAAFTAGNIALIQRGTCTFAQKAVNAEAAGASAVLVFNEGQEGRTDLVLGTLGEPVVDIPVLGTTFALGQELAETDGAVLHVLTDTMSETRETYNVIAETKRGRADNVVISGAHLDSATTGAGINDNGSGSAAQLEVALRFAETVRYPRNKVRFAWWSAEEFGLLGAAAYVASRTGTQLGDIALYLNYDMIASPNYVRFVYDGDNSEGLNPAPVPEGSAEIEDVYERHFQREGLPAEGTPFTGRSDYAPFTAVGIPSGGLFTGAEGIKTEEQAEVYGGTAGEPYDDCYHTPCDTTRNIDNTALDQMADAMAHATATFAFDTSAVNDRARIAHRAAAAEELRAVAGRHAPHGRTLR